MATWTTVNGNVRYVVVAEFPGHLQARVYEVYHNGRAVSLDLVRTSGAHETTIASTDDTLTWDALETLIPRSQWPTECYVGARGPAVHDTTPEIRVLLDASLGGLAEIHARRAAVERATAALRAAIVDAAEAGEPISSIARAADLGRQTIYRWLDDAKQD